MMPSNSSIQSNICFIGSGNMATSLIGGLVASGYPSDKIISCDIDQSKLEQLRKDFKIRTETDNNLAIAGSDIVLLAVKPQILQSVCIGLTHTTHKPLFISIAAGVREPDINRWLGSDQAIVRCMPNTPALVGLGASALYANNSVSASQRQVAEKILQSTGITVWVEQESDLDAVTAISGSGPAYFFLFMEALQNAAQELGLSEETAANLVSQTALGASTMALGKDVVSLRQQVTSRGGTTEQAIKSFQQNNLQQVVLEAANAAARRSIELAEELGK
jgi:pyrroline-5-carboxylate reductase